MTYIINCLPVARGDIFFPLANGCLIYTAVCSFAERPNLGAVTSMYTPALQIVVHTAQRFDESSLDIFPRLYTYGDVLIVTPRASLFCARSLHRFVSRVSRANKRHTGDRGRSWSWAWRRRTGMSTTGLSSLRQKSMPRSRKGKGWTGC